MKISPNPPSLLKLSDYMDVAKLETPPVVIEGTPFDVAAVIDFYAMDDLAAALQSAANSPNSDIYAFLSVTPKLLRGIREAAYHFPTIVELALTEEAAAQLHENKILHPETEDSPVTMHVLASVASVGASIVLDNAATHVEISHRYYNTYGDEIYALVLNADLPRLQKLAGFNYAQFEADVKAL